MITGTGVGGGAVDTFGGVDVGAGAVGGGDVAGGDVAGGDVGGGDVGGGDVGGGDVGGGDVGGGDVGGGDVGEGVPVGVLVRVGVGVAVAAGPAGASVGPTLNVEVGPANRGVGVGVACGVPAEGWSVAGFPSGTRVEVAIAAGPAVPGAGATVPALTGRFVAMTPGPAGRVGVAGLPFASFRPCAPR